MTDSNIRQFPGAEVPEQTLSIERRPFGFCGHEKITLDEHNRTVKCAACGKVFTEVMNERDLIAWETKHAE